MSKYTDLAMERRSQFTPEGRPAWNCCQAVVSVFAQDAGYDEDACMKAATYFRGGMQIGSVCGAITGSLMAIGLAGLDDPNIPGELFRKIKENHNGLINCKDLLRVNAENGGEKMPHCNAMIRECIGYVEEILRGEGKTGGQMKTALIMEGGAMRGMFTCGVMDVLMENGIAFDGAAGISAGAVFGCNFKSGQIGRPVRYNKKYCRNPRYCSIRSWLKTGDLYGADFCYRELPDALDPFDRNAFARNPMDFYVGATDVDTGKCIYHRCTDGGETDMLWFRASASMPVVSRPVRIDGHSYLDGGIADAVPYAYMEHLGYNRNVIVLTQPKGYRKKPETSFVMKLFLRRFPKICEAMEHRHEMYNRQMDELDRMEAGKSALIIRPPEDLRIGHTEKNPAELERVYQVGRQEAEKRLTEIRQWLLEGGS